MKVTEDIPHENKICLQQIHDWIMSSRPHKQFPHQML